MWAPGSLSCQVYTEASDSLGRESVESGPMMLWGVEETEVGPPPLSCSGRPSCVSIRKHLTTQGLASFQTNSHP